MRRMYSKFSNIMDTHGNRITTLALKSHHHIRLDQEFKLDCAVWIQFLVKSDAQTNRCLGLCCPFIDLELSYSANVLDFYTDATKGVSLGMGGVFQNKWYFAQWEHNYIEQCDLSIEYLELLALCTAVFMWSRFIANKRIILFL